MKRVFSSASEEWRTDDDEADCVFEIMECHRGIPTVVFGAIDADSGFHMPDEFIRIETLKKMVQAVKQVYNR